ncbi:hypothetical protein EPN44_03530 [bacterium]|nr:MAG: hypothetical protein EPN44_03530 [bacterium]
MRGVSSLTDAVTAEAVGALWLERVLEPISHAGRRAKEERRPFAPGQEREARAAIADVLATAERCSLEQAHALRAVVRGLPEPSETLARVAAGGGLEDLDIHQLLSFLDGLHTLRERGAGRLPERLLPVPFEGLHASLARGRQRSGGFYLDGPFDAALVEARAAERRAREAYECERARLREAAQALLGDAAREEGEFAVLRGTFAGLPPEGVRVIREAATYRVFELANDAPALAAFSLLEETRGSVAAAEERVRACITREVRVQADALLAEAQRVGEIDLHLAAVSFALAERAVAPEIVENAEVLMVEARLLPLERRLAEHGRRYVPISLHLDGQAVVTGPNMGGKSAALRTAGFVQLCAQWGLPVPARAARVGFVERICWLGVTAGAADRSGLLSSFGSEIVRLAQALDGIAGQRLLLIDEFARTTSPNEGRALVVALLESLRERGDLALVTTHFAGVAEAAGVPHLAVVGLRRAFPVSGGARPALEEALAVIGDAMDYRLTPAAQSEASGGAAIALARLLGLDDGLTARAERELRSARL